MSTTAYLLSDTARLLRRAFDSRMRQLGMTSVQARLLLNLSINEGENQGFYAERLEVEPITLGRLVDRMAEAGLIERRPDPADRRAWRIHLTECGRLKIDESRESLAGLEEQLLHGMSPAQHTEFAQLLEMIRTNFACARNTEVTVNG